MGETDSIETTVVLMKTKAIYPASRSLDVAWKGTGI